ncbi:MULTISPECIES: DUF1289 domain-containing protein [Methylophaga]|uniref:DUF1289 domain-containing protein n=1 Tax=Methylophaga TaxID=40222 RepID=UPI000C59FC8D|nr:MULTISPECIES: DUF1289 domain-containing protein [Methylophaga]MAX52362.1 DUF1289 domain-containing protein [Methylophaga sp.]
MAKQSTSSKNVIPSPCLRKCCLDERDVCLGCFRKIDEITGWSAMNNNERLKTLDLCQQRRKLRLAQKRKAR